ncbi:MAG: 50S ribosomal protein L11 methyltransferase [Deltaproteobacteria bacterium]|nr:50S ribosomal protein L11 methyltransferase [Deltaproteobacteria bacterium]
METIKKYIIDTVSGSDSKFTPGQLEKQISNKFKVTKKESRNHISDLVIEGELAYTYLFGCSFIEKSFQRPVKIANRIILMPAGTKKTRSGNNIEIELLHGASFGTGRHPTTRLAVRSIEKLFETEQFINGSQKTSALDIGTGSGILAITSVLLGIQKATGTDIESCARKEAKENVELNGLSDRIDISRQELGEIDGTVSLITANLRYPTLMTIHPHIKRLTVPESAVVLSGIRADETEHICAMYSNGFQYMWHQEEAGWACVVFTRI